MAIPYFAHDSVDWLLISLIPASWTDLWIFSFVFNQLVGWLDSGFARLCLYFWWLADHFQENLGS